MLEHISQNWDEIRIAHWLLGFIMGLVWIITYLVFIKPEIDEARSKQQNKLKASHTSK